MDETLRRVLLEALGLIKQLAATPNSREYVVRRALELEQQLVRDPFQSDGELLRTF